MTKAAVVAAKRTYRIGEALAQLETVLANWGATLPRFFPEGMTTCEPLTLKKPTQTTRTTSASLSARSHGCATGQEAASTC